jgi:hypothetical protein
LTSRAAVPELALLVDIQTCASPISTPSIPVGLPQQPRGSQRRQETGAMPPPSRIYAYHRCLMLRPGPSSSRTRPWPALSASASARTRAARAELAVSQ